MHSRHCWLRMQRNYLKSKSGDISPTERFFSRCKFLTNNICANRIFNVTETKGRDRNFCHIFLSYNLRSGWEVCRKNPKERRRDERPRGKGSRKDGRERGRVRRARGIMKSEETRNGDEIAEWKRVSGGILETTTEERCLRHARTAATNPDL